MEAACELSSPVFFSPELPFLMEGEIASPRMTRGKKKKVERFRTKSHRKKPPQPKLARGDGYVIAIPYAAR